MTTDTPTTELLGSEPEGPPDDSGGQVLRLLTPAGPVRCRLHAAPGDAAILWVFGAGGGFGGPAGGVYERLARRFVWLGVSSLQVDFRRPGRLEPCVSDALTGAAFLEGRGVGRLVLVGHSFGGGVVIRAAVSRDSVVAVAVLSSQLHGTERVAALAGKPILVAHGEADEVLPPDCAREIYRRAMEPKELALYPGCRHGLDACRDALDRDLTGWLEGVLELPVR